MTYDEKIALQKLWKMFDQISTAARECEQGRLSHEGFLNYVADKCKDWQRIPFPGNPPELTGEEVGRILRSIERREKGLPPDDADEA